VKPLRIAVIGGGHLGKIHARLLRTVDSVQLVAVTDPTDAARAAAADQFAVPTYASHRQVIDHVDAAVIAAPTPLHHEIAADLIAAGKHVLVEKPLTPRAADSHRLVELARRHRVTLQVGHVERFNPAWTAAAQRIERPKFIEAVRASSFPGRCLDVGVVMDLMIHDLDLVLSMTDAPVTRVDAGGMSVVSEHEDVAEARVSFACGLVAQLKASRISPLASRRMQIYAERGFAEIDFAAPAATVIEPDASILDRSFQLAQAGPLDQFRGELFQRWLRVQTLEVEPRNAILDELHDFVISIQSGSAPAVDGTAGARAVELAERILGEIQMRQWAGGDATGHQRGPHALPHETIEAASARYQNQRRAA
jgi:predicted dehydrogenase